MSNENYDRSNRFDFHSSKTVTQCWSSSTMSFPRWYADWSLIIKTKRRYLRSVCVCVFSSRIRWKFFSFVEKFCSLLTYKKTQKKKIVIWLIFCLFVFSDLYWFLNRDSCFFYVCICKNHVKRKDFDILVPLRNWHNVNKSMSITMKITECLSLKW